MELAQINYSLFRVSLGGYANRETFPMTGLFVPKSLNPKSPRLGILRMS